MAIMEMSPTANFDTVAGGCGGCGGGSDRPPRPRPRRGGGGGIQSGLAAR
jgi:hypothetical protein